MTQARPARATIATVAVAVVLVWLVGLPLLLTLAEALEVGRGGLTFSRFAELARRPDEWTALFRSVWISLASVGLAAAVGVPLAFVFARTDFPGRRALGALVALPVALPPLVGVIAFLFLYGESGFVARALQRLLGFTEAPWRLEGPGAILLVHTYSMYVYFYLFVRAALERLDVAQLEAAAALGAGRLRTLARVVLPQLKPALLGAALLTFLTSIGSFSAPFIFGGGFRVMTTQILATKLGGDLALAQAEAMALATVALLALGVARLAGEDSGGVSAHGVAPAPRRLERPAARIAATTLGWGAAAVLLLPHLTLLLLSFVPAGTWTVEALPPILAFDNWRDLLSRPERLRPIVNSLWMAAAATAAAVVLGTSAARVARRRGGRGRALLEGLLILPWAVPGTVFALALATAFSVHQPLAGRFLWIGTPVILPLAYLVRALPVTGRAAVAALGRFDPALEEAAHGLGAGRLRTLWRVVLPAIRPALFAATGLAFITALGDFVASIVLYTFETRPISIEIQTALRVQDFGVAAAYGVLLMLLSSAAFLVWGRGERAS